MLIISYGGSETAEFKRQSRILAEAWQTHGWPAEIFEHTERNHFDIVFDLCDPDTASVRRVRDFEPDTLYHLAGCARGNPESLYRINLGATVGLLRSLADLASLERVLLAGSSGPAQQRQAGLSFEWRRDPQRILIGC